MRTHSDRIRASTAERLGLVDITERVAASVTRSGISNGQVTVFATTTGCSLVVNERESGLLADIRRAAERIHPDGRTDGSWVGSSSLVLPAVDGALRLGTWQRVLLIELESPCDRSVIVQIVGE